MHRALLLLVLVFTYARGFLVPGKVPLASCWRRKLPVALGWRLEDVDTAAGNPMTIIYEPRDDSEAPIAFLGGFNGWDGEESPKVVIPVVPRPKDGTLVASVPLPEDAKTVEFLFSDGTWFDTDGGELYRLRVRHVRESDASGTVFTYTQEDDGTLVPTGAIEKEDPEELERMIDKELARREKAKQVKAAAAEGAAHGVAVVEAAPHVEAVEEEEEGAFSSPLSKEQEEKLHLTRSEAGLMADQLGIGRLMLPAVRDAYEQFEDSESGALKRTDVGRALNHLGFDLEAEEIKELVDSYVERTRVGVGVGQFMQIYADLDGRGEGIEIL